MVQNLTNSFNTTLALTERSGIVSIKWQPTLKSGDTGKDFDLGNGPPQSIMSLSNGSTITGMGWSRA